MNTYFVVTATILRKDGMPAMVEARFERLEHAQACIENAKLGSEALTEDYFGRDPRWKKGAVLTWINPEIVFRTLTEVRVSDCFND